MSECLQSTGLSYENMEELRNFVQLIIQYKVPLEQSGLSFNFVSVRGGWVLIVSDSMIEFNGESLIRAQHTN